MQARILLVTAVTGAVLALAPPAPAKGPSQVTISGPGLERPLVVKAVYGELGAKFGRLVQSAGFVEATFGGTPGGTTSTAPRDSLGPKYSATYLVPGHDDRTDKIRQEVYPYAEPVPVTFTPAGQPFFGEKETSGGWFRSSPELHALLVERGLPSEAPGGGNGGWSLSLPRAATFAAVAAAIVLATGGFLIARRRTLPASAR